MRVINFVGDTWCAKVDEGDSREDALRIASAVGRLAREANPEGVVYVGYDMRPLSSGLAREVGEVVAAYGVTVRLSDTHCPLSALSEATRRDARSFGALMLTAGSHSVDYFGIRVRVADGSAAGADEIDELEATVVPEVPAARGEVELVDLMTPHLEAISAFVGSKASAAAAPVVVCDPMYGALGSHAARLLASMGAQVVELHNDGDTDFAGIHPEVVEPWIDDCEQAVVEHGASFGIALDGGGDRLALIDERGRLVTPHMMLALVMQYLVREKGMGGRMVAPIFVSTMVRRQAERLGLPLTITSPGYLWMRDEMLSGDVVCSGDAIGGVSIPAIGLERDALAAAAVLTECIAADGRPLSEIVAELDPDLGHMEYGYRNVRLGSGEAQVLRNALPGVNPSLLAGKAPVEVSHPGGIMARFEDGSWLMVRPSKTASLVRIYAEAPDPASRDALLSAGAELARSPMTYY